ncbi:methyltransferase family protein [Paraglaciecola sp.]|uniref:methyltransferase family protein n=1 Tax=Paraglaciecola sp. TaxID=1920173 RepID=UPI003EF5B81F
MLQQHTLGARVGVLLFNSVSYFVGCTALVLLILIFGHVITAENAPIFNGPEFSSLFGTIIWNLAWVVGFGYKHSYMASIKFRDFIIRFIPEAMNRGLYTLATGVYLFLLLYFWSPLEGRLWDLEGSAYLIVMSIFLFGWTFLFLATFMIDHFELFGLKQAFYYFKQKKIPTLSFVKNGFYAYVRHPIMTGLLIGIWVVPVMTYSLLMLTVGFSVYVFVGVYFEERKLKRILGSVYHDYCQQVGGLIPKIPKKLRAQKNIGML